MQPVTILARGTRLTLSREDVCIRKNGVEFRSALPIAAWTELTVMLQTPQETEAVHCNGVVVACCGSRHDGYIVSMLFTSLSEESQARLALLAA